MSYILPNHSSKMKESLPKLIMTYRYSKACPPCIRFAKKWEELNGKYERMEFVSLEYITGDEEQNERFNIMFGKKARRVIIEYITDKKRTYEFYATKPPSATQFVISMLSNNKTVEELLDRIRGYLKSGMIEKYQ